MKIFLAVGAVLGASTLLVLWLIRRSPEGYEDAKGFHRGSPGNPTESPAPKSADRPDRPALRVRTTIG